MDRKLVDETCSDRSVFVGISSLMRPTVSTGNPPRRSGWEIHPVYSIDVCEFKTLATCRVDREDVWTPLADWLLPGDVP